MNVHDFSVWSDSVGQSFPPPFIKFFYLSVASVDSTAGEYYISAGHVEEVNLLYTGVVFSGSVNFTSCGPLFQGNRVKTVMVREILWLYYCYLSARQTILINLHHKMGSNVPLPSPLSPFPNHHQFLGCWFLFLFSFFYFSLFCSLSPSDDSNVGTHELSKPNLWYCSAFFELITFGCVSPMHSQSGMAVNKS